MGKIGIQGAEVFMMIGVTNHEKITPQKIQVNIEVEYNLKASSQSDNINDTIDYALLSDAINSLHQEPCHLLETAARKICAHILEKSKMLSGMKITLFKEDPFPLAYCNFTTVEFQYSEDW